MSPCHLHNIFCNLYKFKNIYDILQNYHQWAAADQPFRPCLLRVLRRLRKYFDTLARASSCETSIQLPVCGKCCRNLPPFSRIFSITSSTTDSFIPRSLESYSSDRSRTRTIKSSVPLLLGPLPNTTSSGKGSPTISCPASKAFGLTRSIRWRWFRNDCIILVLASSKGTCEDGQISVLMIRQ